MADVPLSDATRDRVAMLFAGSDVDAIADLLVQECGNNLPFLHDLDAVQLERFRFAALKLSDGRVDALLRAIVLAQTDWRDLLMAAGFGQDIHAHEHWLPASHDDPP